MEYISGEDPPVLARGCSDSLAKCLNVDKAQARNALNLTMGDMDSAAIMLMNGVVDGVTHAVHPADELMTLGGITREQANEFLSAVGGDIIRAKENLLISMDISEKASSYLRRRVASYPCPICDEHTTLVQLQECDHMFCEECLQSWIRAQSSTSSNGSIKCPQSGCLCFINYHELKELLCDDENLFEQIDRRALEVLSASESTMHSCTSPDCTYIVSWDPDDLSSVSASFICPMCSVERCLACGSSPYHHNMTCTEHLNNIRLQQQTQSGIGEAGDLRAQEEATMEFLRKSGFRICKKCKHGVVKSSGCLKMKCRCGYRFCYECNAEEARCDCTPPNHGFWDNISQRGDFRNLR